MRRPHPDSIAADNPWNEVLQLERAATRFEQRFGEGKRILWHRWGAGPAVLLFHGGGGSWTHWLRTLPALIPHFTVWIPDLPGYGDSDMPDAPLTFSGIAQLVADGIDGLLPRDTRFDLVAFSFGTLLAIPLAKRFPQRMRRLVLVGSNVVGHVSLPPYANWKKAASESERDSRIRQNLMTSMLHDPARVDDFAVQLQMDNVARQRLSTPAIGGLQPLFEAIAELPPGVQLAGISGANDFLVDGKMQRQVEVFRRFPGGAPFSLVADASHWVMYDDPAGFNREVLDILMN